MWKPLAHSFASLEINMQPVYAAFGKIDLYSIGL
jgi:hypothetical protein